jgi:hypothetical protein
MIMASTIAPSRITRSCAARWPLIASKIARVRCCLSSRRWNRNSFVASGASAGSGHAHEVPDRLAVVKRILGRLVGEPDRSRSAAGRARPSGSAARSVPPTAPNSVAASIRSRNRFRRVRLYLGGELHRRKALLAHELAAGLLGSHDRMHAPCGHPQGSSRGIKAALL